jgi:GNAT superfamily N-acetyltransferase
MQTTQASELRDAVWIREMQTDDAEAVAELTSQLGYERTVAEIRQWIAGLISVLDRQAAFVACLGEKVVGWVEVSLERRLQSPVFALIGGLVVSAEYRNHRVGRVLCERAEAWGFARGATTLRVTSRITRSEAHRFYVREGFELVKTSAVFEKKHT